MTITQDLAETVALKALGWLAATDDLLDTFMGATGIARDDLRAAAADPETQIAVLDFLMMDDAWVVAFCDAEGLSYEVPQQARQALPGGATVHWT